MSIINKRKLCLMSVLIVFCILFVSIALFNGEIAVASADTTYVAQVGETKYKSYSNALSAVSDGGTITMLNDWTTTGVITLNDNIKVTINMNGHMINRNLTSAKGSGEIFLLKPNSMLTLNGQTKETERYGVIKDSIWHYNTKGNFPIKGALLTGGYNSNGGGAVHIQKNAVLNVNNVTIAGNVSTDTTGAGAIRLQGSSAKLNVTNSEISYNKATAGGGGAIRIEGENSTVTLDNSRIHHSIVTNEHSDGGAIQINNGTVNLIGTEISFNESKRNGGGIYISKGNLTVDKNSIIARNVSRKEGGAIYVDSNANRVEISGTLSGNSAKEEGGAIYVNSSINGTKGVRLTDVDIVGNKAVGNGGGVYVDENDNVALLNKVVINGSSPNNLYIKKDSAIKENSLSEGSMVGITTSWNATSSKPIKTTGYEYFTCDKLGYEVAGTSDRVYFVKSSTTTPTSMTLGGETFSIDKGSYVYNSNAGGQMTAYYYYSDGYFYNSAIYYNEHLATMSLALASSAITATMSGEYTPEKGAKNIIDLFNSMGFSNLMIHFPEPEYFGTDSEILSTIGYVIASKTATIGGKEVTILATAVRGGGYGAEWASNVTLGDGVGEAKGFSDAANQVEKGIAEYVESNGIDGNNTKFWVTGYSRAAATTNLVTKRLTDKYGQNNVYGYCFETPRGGVYSEMKKGLHYSNIHSIINKADVVTYVGTTQMGLMRYGVDHVVPAYKVGTDGYKTQKTKMLSQLSAINPHLQFNDYFHEASIEYVNGYLFGNDYVQENTFTKHSKAEDWVPYFIEKLQLYSLSGGGSDGIYDQKSSNWHGYRSFYSDHTWLLYHYDGKVFLHAYDKMPEDTGSVALTALTLEQSIANIVNFYFGSSSELKTQIMSVLDLGGMLKKLSLGHIYWKVIGKWHEFSISKKNSEFNSVWTALEIESTLKDIISKDDMTTLKLSMFVILDFLLDFVSEDYCYTDQDVLGTFIYNSSNILQTHFYDVTTAWVRSYDSYYLSDIASPPLPPEINLESGAYNKDITLELTASNKEIKIYYTINGDDPKIDSESTILYDKPIKLGTVANSYETYSIKAISVLNGLMSEVKTYRYNLTTNALISYENDLLRVYNFEDTAYLIIAEYVDGVMQAVDYFEVTNNSYLVKSQIELNFDNDVVAYLVRDLNDFSPLCAPYSIKEGGDDNKEILNIEDVVNTLKLSGTSLTQVENPEYVNCTFSTYQTNVEQFTFTILAENSKDNFDKVLYFSQIKRSDDNNYSITFKRSLLVDALGTQSVHRSKLYIVLSGNGVAEKETSTRTYFEMSYGVTYYLNDGVNNPDNPYIYTISTPDITLLEPTREHHDFAGWYNNENYEGTPITIIPMGTNDNTILFAKWTIKNYTVTYEDGVGGEAFANKVTVVEYNKETPSFGENEPTRAGYHFVGWTPLLSANVIEDVTYSAVWQQDHVHTPTLVSGVEPTCCTAGYKDYYVCEDCGYYEDEPCTKQIFDIDDWKENAGKLTKDHDFTEQIQDFEHLVYGTGKTCQDVARYYYSCIDCHTISTIEWESDLYGAHNFDSDFTTLNGAHYHVCLVEGCNETTAKISCSGGSATCKSKSICEVCSQEYGSIGEHNLNTTHTQSNGQHYYECMTEGCDYTTEKENCHGGNATCSTHAICETCHNPYGELIQHVVNDDLTCNATQHWHECNTCGGKLKIGDHVDANGDNVCDECKHVMNDSAIIIDEKIVKTTNVKTIAITVAVTFVVTCLVFGLIWFIKKRNSY